MYKYQLVWHQETVNEETGDKSYTDFDLSVVKTVNSTDDKYKVVTVTFKECPEFEYYEYATFSMLDKNNKTILKNQLEIEEDKCVGICEDSVKSQTKISLEDCVLINNQLTCKIYFE